MNYEGYFDARGVRPIDYENYALPAYLLTALPKDKSASILDLGCGYCQFINHIVSAGKYGMDLNPPGRTMPRET